MLAALAMLNPSMHTGEALKLLVCHGSELRGQDDVALRQSVAVDPLTSGLAQVHEQAHHVTAADAVGAVVAGLPEDHRLATQWEEVDLFSGAALRGGNDDAGVENVGHVPQWLMWLVYREGGAMLPPCCIASQFPQHLVHLVCIDGGVVPCHTVASLAKVATDLPIHHAANELIPWGLKTLAVGHTCLSGVVQKLIVSDPQGSIPGFVVGVTVHGLVCCVDVVSLQGQGRIRSPAVYSASAVTLRAGGEVQKRTPTAARMMSRNI